MSEQDARGYLTCEAERLASEAARGFAPQTTHIKYGYDTACDSLRRLALLRLQTLAAAKLWPENTQDSRLAGYLRSIREFIVPDIGATASIDLCGRCIATLTEDNFNNLAFDLEALAEAIFAGVCLDCFRAGGSNEGSCRSQHAK